MKKSIIFLFFGAFFSVNFACLAIAEDKGGGLWPVPDYTGNIWDRPALTGDWGGFRTDMGQ